MVLCMDWLSEFNDNLIWSTDPKNLHLKRKYKDYRKQKTYDNKIRKLNWMKNCY